MRIAFRYSVAGIVEVGLQTRRLTGVRQFVHFAAVISVSKIDASSAPMITSARVP